MIPRLAVLAFATLAWALANPINDPSITLYEPWGIGVHGSDLLPVAIAGVLAYREWRQRELARSNVAELIERVTPRPTTYEHQGEGWLS